MADPDDRGGASVATQPDAISFYSTKDAYGEFSNFAAYPIVMRGVQWRTNEHFFQAQKFAGTEHEEAIRRVASPAVAARMGRSRQRTLRSDWEAVKDDIMLEAIRAKFAQHPALARLLLCTGDVLIVEHTACDHYWGDGGDGSGKSMLGRPLMRVRGELRAQM